MTWFKKEDRDLLARMHAVVMRLGKVVEGRNELVQILKEQNEELRRDNKDMLDRIMATNYQDYTFGQGSALDLSQPNLEEFWQDEEVAGEVLLMRLVGR